MHNSDLGTVEVHVSRVSDTPPPRCPGLTVDVAVLAVEPALVTGLRAVDQHVAGVPPALVLPGPVITGLVSVSTARLRFHCRFHCGLDGAASDLGIAGTRVESVDLSHSVLSDSPCRASVRLSSTPRSEHDRGIISEKIILSTLVKAWLP